MANPRPPKGPPVSPPPPSGPFINSSVRHFAQATAQSYEVYYNDRPQRQRVDANAKVTQPAVFPNPLAGEYNPLNHDSAPAFRQRTPQPAPPPPCGPPVPWMGENQNPLRRLSPSPAPLPPTGPPVPWIASPYASPFVPSIRRFSPSPAPLPPTGPPVPWIPNRFDNPYGEPIRSLSPSPAPLPPNGPSVPWMSDSHAHPVRRRSPSPAPLPPTGPPVPWISRSQNHQPTPPIAQLPLTPWPRISPIWNTPLQRGGLVVGEYGLDPNADWPQFRSGLMDNVKVICKPIGNMEDRLRVAEERRLKEEAKLKGSLPPNKKKRDLDSQVDEQKAEKNGSEKVLNEAEKKKLALLKKSWGYHNIAPRVVGQKEKTLETPNVEVHISEVAESEESVEELEPVMWNPFVDVQSLGEKFVIPETLDEERYHLLSDFAQYELSLNRLSPTENHVVQRRLLIVWLATGGREAAAEAEENAKAEAEAEAVVKAKAEAKTTFAAENAEAGGQAGTGAMALDAVTLDDVRVVPSSSSTSGQAMTEVTIEKASTESEAELEEDAGNVIEGEYMELSTYAAIVANPLFPLSSSSSSSIIKPQATEEAEPRIEMYAGPSDIGQYAAPLDLFPPLLSSSARIKTRAKTYKESIGMTTYSAALSAAPATQPIQLPEAFPPPLEPPAAPAPLRRSSFITALLVKNVTSNLGAHNIFVAEDRDSITHVTIWLSDSDRIVHFAAGEQGAAAYDRLPDVGKKDYDGRSPFVVELLTKTIKPSPARPEALGVAEAVSADAAALDGIPTPSVPGLTTIGRHGKISLASAPEPFSCVVIALLVKNAWSASWARNIFPEEDRNAITSITDWLPENKVVHFGTEIERDNAYEKLSGSLKSRQGYNLYVEVFCLGREAPRDGVDESIAVATASAAGLHGSTSPPPPASASKIFALVLRPVKSRKDAHLFFFKPDREYILRITHGLQPQQKIVHFASQEDRLAAYDHLPDAVRTDRGGRAPFVKMLNAGDDGLGVQKASENEEQDASSSEDTAGSEESIYACGLLVGNVRKESRVKSLFDLEDRCNITDIVKNKDKKKGQGRTRVVKFVSQEARDAAFAHLPDDIKKDGTGRPFVLLWTPNGKVVPTDDTEESDVEVVLADAAVAPNEASFDRETTESRGAATFDDDQASFAREATKSTDASDSTSLLVMNVKNEWQARRLFQISVGCKITGIHVEDRPGGISRKRIVCFPRQPDRDAAFALLSHNVKNGGEGSGRPFVRLMAQSKDVGSPYAPAPVAANNSEMPTVEGQSVTSVQEQTVSMHASDSPALLGMNAENDDDARRLNSAILGPTIASFSHATDTTSVVRVANREDTEAAYALPPEYITKGEECPIVPLLAQSREMASPNAPAMNNAEIAADVPEMPMSVEHRAIRPLEPIDPTQATDFPGLLVLNVKNDKELRPLFAPSVRRTFKSPAQVSSTTIIVGFANLKDRNAAFDQVPANFKSGKEPRGKPAVRLLTHKKASSSPGATELHEVRAGAVNAQASGQSLVPESPATEDQGPGGFHSSVDMTEPMQTLRLLAGNPGPINHIPELSVEDNDRNTTGVSLNGAEVQGVPENGNFSSNEEWNAALARTGEDLDKIRSRLYAPGQTLPAEAIKNLLEDEMKAMSRLLSLSPFLPQNGNPPILVLPKSDAADSHTEDTDQISLSNVSVAAKIKPPETSSPQAMPSTDPAAATMLLLVSAKEELVNRPSQRFIKQDRVNITRIDCPPSMDGLFRRIVYFNTPKARDGAWARLPVHVKQEIGSGDLCVKLYVPSVAPEPAAEAVTEAETLARDAPALGPALAIELPEEMEEMDGDKFLQDAAASPDPSNPVCLLVVNIQQPRHLIYLFGKSDRCHIKHFTYLQNTDGLFQKVVFFTNQEARDKAFANLPDKAKRGDWTGWPHVKFGSGKGKEPLCDVASSTQGGCQSS